MSEFRFNGTRIQSILPDAGSAARLAENEKGQPVPVRPIEAGSAARASEQASRFPASSRATASLALRASGGRVSVTHSQHAANFVGETAVQTARALASERRELDSQEIGVPDSVDKFEGERTNGSPAERGVAASSNFRNTAQQKHNEKKLEG